MKIFIGNMSEETKTEDLQALFEQYGEVTECAVLNRYGFVVSVNIINIGYTKCAIYLTKHQHNRIGKEENVAI